MHGLHTSPPTLMQINRCTIQVTAAGVTASVFLLILHPPPPGPLAVDPLGGEHCAPACTSPSSAQEPLSCMTALAPVTCSTTPPRGQEGAHSYYPAKVSDRLVHTDWYYCCPLVTTSGMRAVVLQSIRCSLG